jgi:hypothetical protein
MLPPSTQPPLLHDTKTLNVSKALPANRCSATIQCIWLFDHAQQKALSQRVVLYFEARHAAHEVAVAKLEAFCAGIVMHQVCGDKLGNLCCTIAHTQCTLLN